MSRTSSIPASQLVHDDSIYPRVSVDHVHVRRLADAMESGATLPPIIACDATYRVVDGIHRLRAAVQINGEDGLITVELRHYETELDIYMDAVELNSRHGKPLGPSDVSRITIRARELGARNELIAALLAIRPDVLQRRVRTAVVGNGSKRHEIALKACLSHLQGKELTPPQAKFNSTSLGFTQESLMRELLAIIRTGSLDIADPRVASLAAQLRDELAAVFEEALAA